MMVSETIRNLVDDWASAVIRDEDPDTLLMRSLFMDFSLDFDYAPASFADSARWDISELADAPWGPQSTELCVETLLAFANEWLALEESDNEDIQQAFFTKWSERAQARLSDPLA